MMNEASPGPDSTTAIRSPLSDESAHRTVRLTAVRGSAPSMWVTSRRLRLNYDPPACLDMSRKGENGLSQGSGGSRAGSYQGQVALQGP